MRERYPGQAYYWRHNPNIRRAEIYMLIQKGLTILEKLIVYILVLLLLLVFFYFRYVS